MIIFQNSKKYFKRAELARKEEEEYFKRCGYNVSSVTVWTVTETLDKLDVSEILWPQPLLFTFSAFILFNSVHFSFSFKPSFSRNVYSSLRVPLRVYRLLMNSLWHRYSAHRQNAPVCMKELINSFTSVSFQLPLLSLLHEAHNSICFKSTFIFFFFFPVFRGK